MDSNLNEWLNLVFRWIHVLAGVMWIGHLWFFNFVNTQLAKTYDPDSRKKVVPELMPRALYDDQLSRRGDQFERGLYFRGGAERVA